MRVLILGGDGYLGWPTAMHFSNKGHEVMVVDNLLKRQLEQEVNGIPLWEIPTLQRRAKLWHEVTGKEIKIRIGSVTNYHFLCDKVFEDFRPDVVIDYAEQPSAPYSMRGAREAGENTLVNNILGTSNIVHAIMRYTPDAHLIKLGTMGEYGTPNIDIEEGWLELEHNGRKDRVIYPKRPGSIYHASKVADSTLIEFWCRAWNLRATDLNQGVVYGIDTKETESHPDLRTSFHYDETFGTVINRFCAQAVAGVSLTVYGKGGQTRGFLNIKDTLQCVELAAMNPAEPGEFRVFNQFTEIFRVWELAKMVQDIGFLLGIRVARQHWENPRVEAGEHYYNAKNTSLISLGLKPHLLTDEVLRNIIERIQKDKNLIDTSIISPKTQWKMKK